MPPTGAPRSPLRASSATSSAQWRFRHDTEDWLSRTAPAPWRADAVRRMLREAPQAAREAFEIAPDGSGFTVGAAVVVAAPPGLTAALADGADGPPALATRPVAARRAAIARRNIAA